MPSPLRMKNGCSTTRVLTSKSPRGPPNGPALPWSGTRTCMPESTPAGIATLTRSSPRPTPPPAQASHASPSPRPRAAPALQGGKRAIASPAGAPRALLLPSEVLELRVDDLALLRTGGTAGSAASLRTRAWTGRLLPCLGLRLAVHGLAELVGRLRQRLLRPLHALEVVRLERLL